MRVFAHGHVNTISDTLNLIEFSLLFISHDCIVIVPAEHPWLGSFILYMFDNVRWAKDLQ